MRFLILLFSCVLFLNLRMSGAMIPAVRAPPIRPPRPLGLSEGCYVTVYIHGRGVLAGHLRNTSLADYIGVEHLFSVHIAGYEDLVAPLRFIIENDFEYDNFTRYYIKVSDRSYTHLSAPLVERLIDAQRYVSLATYIPLLGHVGTLYGSLYYHPSPPHIHDWAF